MLDWNNFLNQETNPLKKAFLEQKTENYEKIFP